MLYPLKRIAFNGETRSIILQTVNGPCPLIAICNILLLRGQLKIHPQQREITFEELSIILKDYLQQLVEHASNDAGMHESKVASMLHNYEDAIKLLPNLEQGLDINVIFSSCIRFEYTPEIALFDLLGIRMVHGWVVDTEDAALSRVLAGLSYNQAVDLVTTDVMSQANLDDATKAQKIADQQMVQRFLNESSGQLTVAGLSQMHETIEEDVGILSAAPVIVWQRIGYIDGDDTFLDCNFRLPEEPRPKKPEQQLQPTVAALPARPPPPQMPQAHPGHRRPREQKDNDSCIIL